MVQFEGRVMFLYILLDGPGATPIAGWFIFRFIPVIVLNNIALSATYLKFRIRVYPVFRGDVTDITGGVGISLGLARYHNAG